MPPTSTDPDDTLPDDRADLLQATWARDVEAPVSRLWDAVEAFGGEPGYYGCDVVWHLRADVDRVLGGPGRGTPRPDRRLRAGDPVGLWVVEDIEPGRRLVLRAGTRMPGTAWLEALTTSTGPATSRLELRQPFRPGGLIGTLYWRAERPGHHLVYARMATAMARAAEQRAAGEDRDTGQG